MIFSQKEQYVISADEMTHSLACWDTKTGELLKKVSGHSDVIRCVATSPFDSGVLTCRYLVSVDGG